MAFYLYRINGGEALGMSTSSYGSLPTYFAEVNNPTEQDGAGLSPKKIYTGGVLRNATAGEITAFAAAKVADDKAASQLAAKSLLDDGVFSSPVVRGLAELILDEINILRANDGLAARTKTQLINAIKSKIDGLS